MEKHDLRHELPQFEEKIHELKISNNHFKKLFDEYHEVNTDIHRYETQAEVVSDEVLNSSRRRRVFLKDELYTILTNN